MARPGDPKGYYARLGLAAWATQQAIDVAFRARTRELGPDRGPPPDSAHRLQAVAEAYRTLSDPVLRRAYDDARGIADEEGEGVPPAAAAPARWHHQRPLLFGLVASASAALIVVAIVRMPETMVPSPARALTPPVAAVPRYERRIVTGSGVNLRSGPGTEHLLAGRVARGESVELMQPESDGWAYVRLGDGRRGYIAARFLTTP